MRNSIKEFTESDCSHHKPGAEYECHCKCHEKGVGLMHFIACCSTCKQCKRRIKREAWDWAPDYKAEGE